MTLLSVRGLSAFYGSFQALFDVSLEAATARRWRSSAPTARARPRCSARSRACCRCPPPTVHFDGDAGGRAARARAGRPRRRAGARGTADLPQPHRRGEPPDRRLPRPAGPLDARARLRRCSRCWPSGAASRARTSRAASSRCWPSAAGSWPTRASCSWTRSRWAWRRSWSRASTASCATIADGGHHDARGRPEREPDPAAGPARVLPSQGRGLARGPARGPDARADRRGLLRGRGLTVGWVDTILQGLLLGGLYALFATGLSLIFGVMRIVNLAHGDLSILAAFLAVVVVETLGLNPFVALALVVPLMAALGYALQTLVLNRLLGRGILPPILVTFGLSIIIQNALLETFSADSRRLNPGGIETASLSLGARSRHRLVPVHHAGGGGADPGRAPARHQPPVGGARLPRHLRRSGDGRADGHRQPAALRAWPWRSRSASSRSPACSSASGPRSRSAAGPTGCSSPSRPSSSAGWARSGARSWAARCWAIAQTVGAKLSPGWGILTGHLVFLAVLLLPPAGALHQGGGGSREPRRWSPRSSGSSAPRPPSRVGAVGAALVLIALVSLPAWGDSEHDADPGGVHRPARAGPDVEPARRVCRARLHRAAGLRRPRRLCADRAGRRSRREPVPRRSRWRGWWRPRSRCPPPPSSSASAEATSRWARGPSPKSTACSSPTRPRSAADRAAR